MTKPEQRIDELDNLIRETKITLSVFKHERRLIQTILDRK